MEETNLPSPQKLINLHPELEAKIAALKKELNAIESQTDQFEAKLRTELWDFIIEAQELTALYKELQKFKKQRKLQQKQKGKKLQNQTELIPIAPIKPKEKTDNQKAKKTLYREGMMLTHPDHFSIEADKEEEATELTVQLIDIYKNGEIEELEDFVNYLKGNISKSKKGATAENTSVDYLYRLIAELEEKIAKAKLVHTYVVLTEYKNPMDFLKELQDYYEDRIFKLKKRTRKADKLL